MRGGVPVLCLSGTHNQGNYQKRVLATKYAVTLIDSFDEMEALPSDQTFAVLVVSHNVERIHRHCVIQAARMRWPWIRVLSISSPFTPDIRDSADAAIGALAGPFALLTSVADLLETPNPLMPAA